MNEGQRLCAAVPSLCRVARRSATQQDQRSRRAFWVAFPPACARTSSGRGPVLVKGNPGFARDRFLPVVGASRHAATRGRSRSLRMKKAVDRVVLCGLRSWLGNSRVLLSLFYSEQPGTEAEWRSSEGASNSSVPHLSRHGV